MQQTQHSPEKEPRFRSGAVARMVQMPVTTLRVWERRYHLSAPALSPSGQRLYSTADVQRLGLLKQLTDLGHAIGSLASLDWEALQQVATTHDTARNDARLAQAAKQRDATPEPPCHIAVVGQALGMRLERPALTNQLKDMHVVAKVFEDVYQAQSAHAKAPFEAVLIHAPQLHEAWLAEFRVAAPTLALLPIGVLYHFAPEPVCVQAGKAGIAVLREPQSDMAVSQWLEHWLGRKVASLRHATANRPVDGRRSALPVPTPLSQPGKRRWSDQTLVSIANRSSAVACECPRHIAELLMQLSHFESYSIACESRNPADSELHAYLSRISASARALFESAMEQVAQREGIPLPP